MKESLVEIDGCVFLASELAGSHGFEELDGVGRECFVNHVHFKGVDHLVRAEALVQNVIAALEQGWPGQQFRVYVHSEGTESTVRFHKVWESEPNWYDSGSNQVKVIEVQT